MKSARQRSRITTTVGNAAVVLAVLASSALCREDQTTFFPGDPIRGREVYLAKGCAACHKIWGSGETLGPTLGNVGRGRTFPQLAGLLWSHSPKMFAVMRERRLEPPRFEGSELPDLLAFLYALNYFDEPGDPSIGQHQFREKSCDACHVVGEPAVPGKTSLDAFGSARSPLMLAQAMWNAAPRIRAALPAANVPAPAFVGREMADILAFVRSRAARGSASPTHLSPGDAKNGRSLFDDKKCSQCHSVSGPSPGPGKSLRFEAAKRSVTELAGILWNHSFEMFDEMTSRKIEPVSFTPGEMADLTAFLYYVPYADLDGNVDHGRTVFVAKGCESCHDGETVVQTAYASMRTPSSNPGDLAGVLITQMWNHAPRMEKMALELEVPWPRFEGDEMRDVLSYLLAALPATVLDGGEKR